MSKKHKKAGQKNDSLTLEGEPNEQRKVDKSVRVFQRDKIKIDLTIRERDDFTERQKVILEVMADKATRCVFIDGIFGSGKTFLAVLGALKLLNEGKVDEILYIRNPIESSSTGKLGFLKGDLDEKFSIYTVPLIDKLQEMLPSDQIAALQKDKRIDSVPIGYIRGRNWNCKAVIVDEAAGLTRDDIILLLSRCGEFTRIFLIGDSLNQNDIGTKSGFRDIFNQFEDDESKDNGVYTFELRQATDIVRSKFVKFCMLKLGIIR